MGRRIPGGRGGGEIRCLRHWKPSSVNQIDTRRMPLSNSEAGSKYESDKTNCCCDDGSFPRFDGLLCSLETWNLCESKRLILQR